MVFLEECLSLSSAEGVGVGQRGERTRGTKKERTGTQCQCRTGKKNNFKTTKATTKINVDMLVAFSKTLRLRLLLQDANDME